MRLFLSNGICLIAAFALLACGAERQERKSSSPKVSQTSSPMIVAKAPSENRVPRTTGTSQPRIKNAKQTFNEILALVQQHYVDQDIDEDALYSGAIEGILNRLIQTKNRKVNTILSPVEQSQLQQGLKGSISGIGVVIKKVEGVLIVRKPIPGSPGYEAGLKPDDRILAVNGQSLRDLDLAKSVDLIRGPSGSTLTLLLQRDIRQWTQTLTRHAIKVPTVLSAKIEDGVHYLGIRSFNEKTLGEVDQALATFRSQGMKKLVLDLRACPGGLLDVALKVADRFLPLGKSIVSIRGRDGKKEMFKAKEKDAVAGIPMAVLIDKSSASGAEILAGALQANGRATLLGDRTFGKGTVEKIMKLKNDWALKLSVSRFFSPDGTAIQDTGIIPDLAVSRGKAETNTFYDGPEKGLKNDPQLKAALHLLNLKH
jgi:carboxyl-terminal processing protease